MPEDIRNQLSKLFYPINERVGATMELPSGSQWKNRRKYLLFTVSMTKPYSIQLYLVKVIEREEIKKIILCSTKNIRKFDCRESKAQLSYDLQIISDNKNWIFSAAKLEEKYAFINSFCRVVASLQPAIFKQIELINVPKNLNISIPEQNDSLEILLNPDGDKTPGDNKLIGFNEFTGEDGPTGQPSDGYRSLTTKEEEDIRQFLDELDEKSGLQNAAELTERLQLQLAHVEGTNIHSIMASEPQVLKLMTTLDTAIERTEDLEKQLNIYHQFLEDVEEAMSTLHDHDQLVQVTVDNRAKLLRCLENLVNRLSLDAKSIRALMDADLVNPSGIAVCTDAARRLDVILNVGAREGEEHLSAVDERMQELKRLRDSFAAKLASQVNDTVLRFAGRLSFAAAGSVADLMGSSGVGGSGTSQLGSVMSGPQSFLCPAPIQLCSELYVAQQNELLQLAPLVGTWLQTNRKDIFVDLKRMYVQKLQSFFRRQIHDILSAALQAIVASARPTKAGPGQRGLDHIPVDSGSVMSIYTPGTHVLSQVEVIFSECLDQILSIIRTEQAFLVQFFGFRPLSGEGKPVIHIGNDELENLTDCMCRLFEGVDQDAMTFLVSCEQAQPILIMPLLIVASRVAETESREFEPQSAGKKKSEVGARTQVTFASHFLSRITVETKRAFNRYIERLIYSFKESRPSRKARCGVLKMVQTYVDFAECSMVVFTNSSRLVDLERAHGELVRALMVQLERVASESVKTPAEVVQLENYHRLSDILRRLKMSGLDEYRQEAKNRYVSALHEYTKNCMGRPLEKLASFFEGVQAALDAGVRPDVVSYQFAFSKQELRKVIREYPGKEVKRGLESLCKKVEKHLSDEVSLFPVVWRSIQTEFINQCMRFSSLITECYPDSNITLEFTTTDLENYFSEIARSR